MSHPDGRARAAVLIAAAALALPPGTAQAQATGIASAGSRPAKSGPVHASEIIVVSRHRKERAQRVPVAITSVTAKQLAVGNINSVAKLPQLVPSLQVTDFNPRNTSFNIRGIGNQVAIANDGLEDGVGVYVDGVLQSRPAQATFSLPNIQGIDVLRGAQGTLFGKNTTAGAVDVHTLQPSFTPVAEFDTSVGNYGYNSVAGYASDSLNSQKTIAGSIAFLLDNRDGDITNVDTRQHYDTSHDRAVQAQLLLTPLDNLTIHLRADYSQQSANCCVQLPVTVLTQLANGQPFPGSFAARTQGLNYTIPVLGVFNRNTDVNSPVYYNTETGGVSATADLRVGDTTFTSITAWRFWNFDPHNDLDDLGLDVEAANNQTDDQRQFSQEFRVTSPDSGPITYTAGVYYFYQDIPGILRIQYGSAAGSYLVEPSTGPALAAAFGGPALNGYTLNSATDVRTNSEAIYGQTTWHVVPTVDLTGGLRGTLEQKTGSFDQAASGGADDNPIDTEIQQSVEASNSSVNRYGAHANDGILSGLVTLSWKPTSRLLVYATYDRGEKTSGINNDGVPLGTSPVIKPERVDDYEVGEKTTLLGDRLVLDLDGFWIEDNDYQAEITNISGNNIETYLANVPKVRSRGFELDARYQPARDVSLFASGVYDDAIYQNFPDGPAPVEVGGGGPYNLTGRPLPGTSRWTLSLGGEVDQPVGRLYRHDLTAYLAGNLSLHTSFHTTPDDSAYGLVPGYGLLNLQFGLRSANGRYDLSVFINNALNQNYYRYLAVATPDAGIIAGAPGDPLTFGLTLRVKL